MKTILFVHERLGSLGGAEQHIFITAPYLKKSFRLNMLYWQLAKKEERASACFDKIFQLDFTKEESALKESLQTLLKEIQPNLIYLHKCLSAPMLELFLESGIPIVRMVHDHEVYCMRGYKYFPWSRRACTKKAGLCCVVPCLSFIKRNRSSGEYGVKYASYRDQMRLIRADLQITASFVVTDFMRRELIRQGYPSERIFLFPPIPQRPKESVELTFSEDNILLFAGQIIRGKGLDILLRTLPLVQNKCKLFILGDGSHKRYCMKLAAALHIEDRVTFYGFVPHEKLPTYYQNATAAILPSVWPEPIATWGLEAMQYGLPVVGFDSGGISAWLKDGVTGFLIPWMNLSRMAEKIDLLLADKKRARELGKNGQAFIEEHYNFEQYIDHLRSKLMELAS